jgi:hypothetical protein
MGPRAALTEGVGTWRYSEGLARMLRVVVLETVLSSCLVHIPWLCIVDGISD